MGPTQAITGVNALSADTPWARRQKWKNSTKSVVASMIKMERVISKMAMASAKNEVTPLPSRKRRLERCGQGRSPRQQKPSRFPQRRGAIVAAGRERAMHIVSR